MNFGLKLSKMSKNLIYSSDPITQLMSDSELQIKEKEELLQTLQDERKRVQDEMDKLFKLHVDGKIPQKGFGRRYNPLEGRIQAIERQIPELQGELDYLKINNLTRTQVIDDSKELYSRWSKLSEEEKRKIVETTIEKIVIGEDEISISLSVLAKT